MLLEIAYGTLTKSYSQGAYFTIEYVQILIFLPSVGAFFSGEVLHYFQLMRHALLGHDYLGVDDLLAGNYKDTQKNYVLGLLGFEFNNAPANIISYFLFFLIIGGVHGLLFLSKVTLRKNKNYPILKQHIETAYYWTEMGAYLRYLFLGVALILMSCVSEMNNFSYSDFRWSWYISGLFLILLL